MSTIRRRPARNDYLSSRTISSGKRHYPDPSSTFLDWLLGCIRIALFPITYPSSILLRIIRSPTTQSLTVKLVLLTTLLTICGIFSSLAVGGFWLGLTSSKGNVIIGEGWFVYGSKSKPTPHSYIPLQPSSFNPDIPYDVTVELELIRPRVGSNEYTGPFMLSVEFVGERSSEVLQVISQPCLPAPPYIPSSLIRRLITTFIPSFPPFPFSLLPNPLRFIPFLPRSSTSHSLHLSPDGNKSSPKEVHFLSRALTSSSKSKTSLASSPFDQAVRGIIPNPSNKKKERFSAVLVSIGREDGVRSMGMGGGGNEEVRTSGWVRVIFKGRNQGIRRILTSHPLIPLLVLPPIAIFLTLSSALVGYAFIACLFRGSSLPSSSNESPRRIPVSTNNDSSLRPGPKAESGAQSNALEKVASSKDGIPSSEFEPPSIGGKKQIGRGRREVETESEDMLGSSTVSDEDESGMGTGSEMNMKD